MESSRACVSITSPSAILESEAARVPHRPETVWCPKGHGFRVVRSPPLWVDRRRGGWSPKPTLLGSSPSRPANLFRRGLLASRPSSELAHTVVRFHPPEPFRSAVAVQVLHLAFDSRHCWFESNPLNQFDFIRKANPTEPASQVGTRTNYLVRDLSAAPPPAPAPDFAPVQRHQPGLNVSFRIERGGCYTC